GRKIASLRHIGIKKTKLLSSNKSRFQRVNTQTEDEGVDTQTEDEGVDTQTEVSQTEDEGIDTQTKPEGIETAPVDTEQNTDST
ncbi:MAG: hypothetical protein WAL28_01820, partial [Nitrososphaeraceae archaeon]